MSDVLRCSASSSYLWRLISREDILITALELLTASHGVPQLDVKEHEKLKDEATDAELSLAPFKEKRMDEKLLKAQKPRSEHLQVLRNAIARQSNVLQQLKYLLVSLKSFLRRFLTIRL